MAANEMEFEFDLSGSSTPANQPEKPETGKKTEEIKAELSELSNFKVSDQYSPTEKLAVAEVNTEEKQKEVKPENIANETEALPKKSNGLVFWFKTNALFIIPALIILIVVIFLYAGSLSKLSTANAQIEELTQAKTAVETQLSESNAKIAELDSTVAKLQEENKNFVDNNAKLKKGINGLTAKNLKREKTRLIKLFN